jgi:hypothetical protein
VHDRFLALLQGWSIAPHTLNKNAPSAWLWVCRNRRPDQHTQLACGNVEAYLIDSCSLAPARRKHLRNILKHGHTVAANIAEVL